MQPSSMQRNSDAVRKRIRELCVEISTLQTAARRKFSRALAEEIAIRQAERSGHELLLWSRHAQLAEKIVDLSRWRDGFAATLPASRPPIVERIERAISA